jgi:hypothetical protein
VINKAIIIASLVFFFSCKPNFIILNHNPQEEGCKYKTLGTIKIHKFEIDKQETDEKRRSCRS